MGGIAVIVVRRAATGGGGGGWLQFGGTLINANDATIAGANGGKGGDGLGRGRGGNGGNGVVAANLDIINGGTIKGGFDGGSGLVQAPAVVFIGGNNALEMTGSSTIAGQVMALGGGSNTLRLIGSANGTFDVGSIGNDLQGGQQYIGFTNFEKTDTGTWTLTGTDVAGETWNLSGGTVVLATSRGSGLGFNVNNGATLAGTGYASSAIINAGGTLAPGPLGGPGVMAIGSLIMQPGSLYLVNISSVGSSMVSTVNASVGGTVQVVFAPGTNPVRSYTILQATSLQGSFSGVTTGNLLSGFNVALGDTSSSVTLNLTAALGAGGSLGPNQQNVAGSINNYFNSSSAAPFTIPAAASPPDPPGVLSPNFLPLFNLTGANLSYALAQVSGEAATDAQQVGFQMTSQFLNLMLDPFVDGRTRIGNTDTVALGFASEQTPPDDVALAYAPVFKAPPMTTPVYEPRWTVWGTGIGGGNRTSGDPAGFGTHDFSATTAGLASGFDYHFSRDTVLGLALAGGGTNWSLSQGLGGGRSDAFQAGIYGTTRYGPGYLAAAFAYSNHWMSTDRFAFASDHLTANFDAQSIGGRLEGGYRFSTAWVGITPYVALQAQSFHTPSYNETDNGGGGFALSFNSRTADDTRSELGARFDRTLALYPNAVLLLRGRLAWAHDWIDDPTLAAVFQMLPGSNFIVNGATPAKNSALTSAGLELRVANGITLLGKFDGEFASRSSTYAGTGTVRYMW
jgi:outer membrane autotransporter protein